jgi:hypothetical protein
MLDQLVELLEGTLVEEDLHALAGRQLPLGVLTLAALRTTPFLRAPHLGAQDVDGGRAHPRHSVVGLRAQLGRPHPPPPHAEAPHPPSARPHPSKPWEPAEEAATAKVEICLSTAPLRHVGQVTSSPQRRTSFSKAARQSEQTYS